MNLVKSEYAPIFNQNVAIHTRHFVFLAQQTETLDNKFGMILPKKKIPTSVQRNLCKRIIRESFRAHTGEQQGLWFIVLAKPRAKEASKKELWTSLDQFWQRLPEALDKA